MTYKLVLIYLAFSIGFFSCKTETKAIVSYRAVAPLSSKTYWFFKGKRKFFTGNTLKIYSQDSIFTFESCGCKSTGHWNIKHDSLFLFFLTTKKEPTVKTCYKPPYYIQRSSNTLIGENKNEFIEILKAD